MPSGSKADVWAQRACVINLFLSFLFWTWLGESKITEQTTGNGEVRESKETKRDEEVWEKGWSVGAISGVKTILTFSIYQISE